MSTTADTMLFITDQLASLGGRIRTRKMFGEYALYCDEKVVALICDDQLFVKITEASKQHVGAAYKEGYPYPGAKPALLIDGDLLDDPARLSSLIDATARSLPLPKKKSKNV